MSIGICFIIAFLCFGAASAQSEPTSARVSVQNRWSTENEAVFAFKASADNLYAFLRAKKNADGSASELYMREDKTTQDFAIRSFGIEFHSLFFGSIKFYGLAREVSSPLFSFASPLRRSSRFHSEKTIALNTAALSLKNAGAAFAVSKGPFDISCGQMLDGTNRVWCAPRFVKKLGDKKNPLILSAALFAGAHTIGLPSGKKWLERYPDYGDGPSWYAAAQALCQNAFFSAHTVAALETRPQTGSREYFIKTEGSVSYRALSAEFGVLTATDGMRNFKGEFLDKNFQLFLNPKVSWKRFSLGIALLASNDAESALDYTLFDYTGGLTGRLYWRAWQFDLNPSITASEPLQLQTIKNSSAIKKKRLLCASDQLTIAQEIKWQYYEKQTRYGLRQCEVELSYSWDPIYYANVSASACGGKKILTSDSYVYADASVAVYIRKTVKKTVWKLQFKWDSSFEKRESLKSPSIEQCLTVSCAFDFSA